MIKTIHIIRSAIKSIFTNRSRSILTILGIVIGVAAIIIVMSIGQGAERMILDQIQGMGSRTIVVLPGRSPEGLTDVSSIFLDSLKDRDLNSLRNKINVPYAEEVMPLVIGASRFIYQDESYQAALIGADEKMSDIFNIHPDEGIFMSPEDVRSAARVAVIGNTVRDELFRFSDPIGQRIRAGDQTFRVIGVLPSKGQVTAFNFDKMVLIPYTTAQQYVLGKKHFDRIVVVADDESNIERTVRDVEITLRANHGITDPDKDDFHIETQASIMETISLTTTMLSILLTSVAAISLIVGGVGIMNIMLVSVTERTREIGLRKAVGATEKSIMSQFLTEAVILTGIGGIVGVLGGVGFSLMVAWLLNYYMNLDWPYLISWSAVILGITVSAGVGILFGLYPAKQAAKKDPIEALRYE